MNKKSKENCIKSINISTYTFGSWNTTTIHSYDEGIITKETTSLNEGELVKTCTVCGDKHSEVIPRVLLNTFISRNRIKGAAYRKEAIKNQL